MTNTFCVLSNAIESKVGSITAEWEQFFNWLRADDEKEKIDRNRIREQGTSLEGVIAGLLPPHRLLDYLENFILYYQNHSKIIAQNHQFIGVNRAYGAFLRRDERAGKLGVFWHTQGSGKSFSMIFYARKIFRKQTGNFTFVVITDRADLDGQIYRNFLHAGTVGKAEAAQPKNGEEMLKFLGQSKRVIFTLIQKFRWPQGQEYPELSARDDIIVIVDEAHRTQYKSLAENMRKGLPNAQFLAFTGTPLLGRERKTNAWFGDYVSEYNFQQSMDNGATVPLFYQKRVPEVLIQNEDLSEEFYQILEDENLDEAQQIKLENRFSKEIEVIKRDARLEVIAQDMVYHFPRRGYLGKGMMVSVDKFTAVKMYDKVQRLWKEQIKSLFGTIAKSASDIEKRRLKQQVDYMRSVEMAVIVSEDADEERKFAGQGLNFKPHRERMNKIDPHGHDIEYNFKDPEHPLQLVFVCAMWLTGFDAPTVSTLYLDKPMKGHTLMQTIARANRVTSWKINQVEKCNGEIVDYYNVFRNMKLALRDYAQGQNEQDEPPVKEKAELFRLLDESVVVDSTDTPKTRQNAPEYQIVQKGRTWDLSRINFDKLREEFKQATYKHIEIADLRAFLQHKLELMLQQNATRTFAQRLQQIIENYNSGGSSTENYYEDLMKFTEDLRAEDERHIREGLTEDELELFDLLRKERMTQDETQKVKLAAKSLLHRLLQEHPRVLVQDWHKDTQTQRVVRSTVEQVLDNNLPESYDRVLFREKCDEVFYRILDYASHAGSGQLKSSELIQFKPLSLQ
ncbi:type I restriction endonuclease subunit R [Nitrosomonas supralitoralis]|uniref:type I restriction endonuclease subunit R n=1 Tax=Nitrosomonas supralitoralis TaxID=2116706 RepID=UPI001F5B7611|nr:HsdR family type I site-specific deoxyribonuclease [Nitrosomonas supralitoralis]